jgi:hypothetical protein
LDCGRIRLQYTDRNIIGTARRLELTAQATKIGYGAPLTNSLSEDICTGLARLLGSTDLSEDKQFSKRLHYFTGATYRQPRLLGTRWVPTVSLYSERRGEFKAYLRSTQVGADVSATRDLADRTSRKTPRCVLCSTGAIASRAMSSQTWQLSVLPAQLSRESGRTTS